MNVPQMAPVLAKMDDMAGHGELNPVKKWWWDLELTEAGGYRPTAHPINARSLQKDLDLKYERPDFGSVSRALGAPSLPISGPDGPRSWH